MNLEIILSFFDLFIVYLSLFIQFFSPVINQLYISESGYNLLLLSFIFDLFLISIGFILSYNKRYLNLRNIFKGSYISKYSNHFNDLIILNIIFRFFPIISHLGNFISGYNRKIYKIKSFFTFVFGYVFILFIGELISKLLWYIFNPTYCTCGDDMNYYSGIGVFIFGLFILFIYIKIKNKLLKIKLKK